MRYDHLNMLPELAFNPLGKMMTLEGGKSKAPKTPDTVGAAKETAAGNLEAAETAAAANRVNQVTPYGNLIYSQNSSPTGFDEAGYNAALSNYTQQLNQYNAQPKTNTGSMENAFSIGTGVNSSPYAGRAPIAPDRAAFQSKVGPKTYTATQTLSPVEQQKLDKNNSLELGLLSTANLGLKGVDDALSKGFNWDALPAAQINSGQTAQDAIMARLNPQFGRDEESLRTRLINQGVRAGSQAWDNEFTNFNQGKNDAYSQAALSGIDVGQRARQQAIQEQEFGRTEGLNMVNALRTGNQVQQPNFINAPQQATTAGPDILGAVNSAYNGQLGATNANNASSAATTNGLMSIAGTAGAFFL